MTMNEFILYYLKNYKRNSEKYFRFTLFDSDRKFK